MVRFALQRLVQTIPVLFLMSAIVFGLIFLLPGDPVLGMLGPGIDLDDASVQQMREDLHLDDPIPVQYVHWLGRCLTGDFGRSVSSKQPVSDALRKRLPVSIQLACCAIFVTLLISLPLGVLAAAKRGSIWDVLASGFSVIGLAIPGFWLAILLVLFLAVRHSWLPSSGYVSPLDSPLQWLRYMALPAITLGVGGAGSLTRQIRSSLLEVLSEDYVRTARAKGLRGQTVLVRHALRNALIPAVTVLGLSLGNLLGGSLIVESIFLVPGIGSLLVNAIFTRDFPVVQAGTLVIAVMVVFINLAVDMLYGILDPRIG
jgi:peptide/nickel transport system permease protein